MNQVIQMLKRNKPRKDCSDSYQHSLGVSWQPIPQKRDLQGWRRRRGGGKQGSTSARKPTNPRQFPWNPSIGELEPWFGELTAEPRLLVSQGGAWRAVAGFAPASEPCGSAAPAAMAFLHHYVSSLGFHKQFGSQNLRLKLWGLKKRRKATFCLPPPQSEHEISAVATQLPLSRGGLVH